MFYVDIEDSSGVRLGAGPITTATSWQVTRRMDAAGAWSFAAPMADVRVAQATPRRYAHIYAWIGGAYQWVGGGPIDTIKTSVAADGTVMADVSGDDMVRELAWRTVGSLALSDGAGQPISHAAALAAVMALAPPGWMANADPAPGWNLVYGQFGGESVLAALATVAERSRSHWALSGRRSLAFGSAFAASGVRCIAASGALGAGQAAITALDIERSSYDLVSRIIPLGSGQASAALTLRATGRTAPAGYTLATAANYLRNDTVETAYGRCERVVSFKDITPLSSTTADVVSAANTLFDAAKYWLDLHAAPVTAYKVIVAQCPTLVQPLQSVRVVWRDPAQNLSLDTDLYVLEVEWKGDATGVRTAGLTVADAPLWPDDDVSAVVDSITQGAIYQALPQLNANSYVIPYSKPVDDVSEAGFRFRFDEDCVQLVRVVFDFQLLPLESTVTSVVAASATTNSGGGTTATSTNGGGTTASSTNGGGTTASSTNGGGSTPTTGSGDKSHLHTVPILNGSAGSLVYLSGGVLYSPGGMANVNINFANVPHTHSVTIGDHSHNVTIGDHSHNVTIGNHNHNVTIPDHTHTVTPSVSMTYGIYRDSAGNVFALADLEYSLDGSTWYGFAVGVNGFANLSGGWYRVDLTALLQDATTLRPLAANNLLRVRRKSTGAIKKATIDAQLGVRNIIQALALT